ncbi:hypothetical protein HGM15179_013921, partial [Zosterops borbonicus]
SRQLHKVKCTHLYQEKKEQPWKTLTCQLHLSALEDHGTDSPSSCAEALGEQGSDLGQPAQLHQG